MGRSGKAHVDEEMPMWHEFQPRVPGSTSSSKSTCLLGTEEHMLVSCAIGQHLNQAVYCVANQAKEFVRLSLLVYHILKLLKKYK